MFYQSLIYRWRRLLLIVLLGLSTTVFSPLAIRMWVPVQRQGSAIVNIKDVPLHKENPPFLPLFKFQTYVAIKLEGIGLEEIWYFTENRDNWKNLTFPFGTPFSISIKQVSTGGIELIRSGKSLESHVLWVEVGWPYKSFAGAYADLYTGMPQIQGKSPEFIGMFRLPDSLIQLSRNGNRATMPIRPMWSGLLANAGIYTCSWFVLLWLPTVTISLIRRLRGKCFKCGYDLRGSTDCGCPECGWGRIDKKIESAKLSA